MVLAAKRKGHKLLAQEGVLIAAENSMRTHWPITVVEELIPGRDGKLGLMKLKTAFGLLLTPIHRIYPLEIYNKEIPKPY